MRECFAKTKTKNEQTQDAKTSLARTNAGKYPSHCFFAAQTKEQEYVDKRELQICIVSISNASIVKCM
jgi:hypothetical protein